jgi:hypothetical protein
LSDAAIWRHGSGRWTVDTRRKQRRDKKTAEWRRRPGRRSSKSKQPSTAAGQTIAAAGAAKPVVDQEKRGSAFLGCYGLKRGYLLLHLGAAALGALEFLGLLIFGDFHDEVDFLFAVFAEKFVGRHGASPCVLWKTVWNNCNQSRLKISRSISTRAIQPANCFHCRMQV